MRLPCRMTHAVEAAFQGTLGRYVPERQGKQFFLSKGCHELFNSQQNRADGCGNRFVDCRINFPDS